MKDGCAGDAEHHLAVAVELYRGEFLEDTPYEDWALAERDQLRLAFLDVASRLADLQFDRADHMAALRTAQNVLQREPCDESAHRLAMRCHAAMGRQSLLVRQYQACTDALDRACDNAPSQETASLFAVLRES